MSFSLKKNCKCVKMNTSNAKTATTSNGRTSTTTNHSMLSDLDLSELCDESVLQLLDEPFNLEDRNAPKLRKDAHYTGFDGSTGNTWIYPTNYQIRQYQFNITQAALFKNTLVSHSFTAPTCTVFHCFLWSKLF